MVHTASIGNTKGKTQRPRDIVFTEADANWVHHPYEDAPVVTAKIANRIIHRMLVDNSSTANILFYDAYQKTELMRADLNPMTTPLYGFIGDHIIPEGTIKLVITLWEHPQVALIVIEFLMVNCPSALDRVISRPLLRALKAATSIYCSIMKFPIAAGTGQVQGK